jgi:hypothetical protein
VKYRILILITLVLIGAPAIVKAQEDKKKPRSTITQLIDQVAEQTDKQIKDRAKEIEMLQKLYQGIEETEKANAERNIRNSRESANKREAMVTADEMLRDPNNNARLAELAAYLRRAITRDQELFDQFVKESETKRFQYERQLAKIRAQQTVLRNIRQDLDRLRLYPNDKERTMFFLTTLKAVVDGLGALPGAKF